MEGEAGMEVVVQVWVNSHGKAGGFVLNEAADAVADSARSSGVVVPGVRVPRAHACAVIPEVKRSHGKWMLDAMQVYSLERMLERSGRTLRPSEHTWCEFVDDPVRSHVLPSQECFELFKDVINPIVKGWHQFDPATQTHESDLDFSKLVFTDEDKALFEKYVKSTRIRAARNISGFSLPAGSTKEAATDSWSTGSRQPPLRST